MRHQSIWKRFAFAAVGLLALGFTAMWVAGSFTYTSVGIDTDRVEGDRVLASYYRVRWPGDGSFWAGAAAHYRPLAEKPPDVIDLGGTLFDKPTRPEPPSFWNRLGFWLVRNAGEDPFSARRYPGAVWSGWVAVPAWLPALAFGLWPVRAALRIRQQPRRPV